MDPITTGALIEGGAGLLGGIFGGSSAKSQARKNRKFQERMARNAHTYEVEDLRRAGLNPILSATGGSGASTPRGAVANTSDIGEGFRKAGSSAREAMFQKYQADLLKSQAALTESQKTGQDTANSIAALNYDLAEQFSGRERQLGLDTSGQQLKNLISTAREIDARATSTGLDAQRKENELKQLLKDPVLQRYVLSQSAGDQAVYERLLNGKTQASDIIKFLLTLRK